MEDLLPFLEKHPLFAGLDRRAIQDVAEHMARRTAHRGEQIVMEGDPSDSAYFIARGHVRVYRLAPNGREQALMDLGPGQVFNLVAAVDGLPAPSSAAARADAELYWLSRESLAGLMDRHPTIAQAALRDFAGRLRQLTGLVEELALHTVAERLARLLLRMSDPQQAPPERFTQQELANQLGTVREVVSRTLRDFEKDGLIRFDRHRIILADRERLSALAQGM
jgi:CRP/FNR family transcriptional regulator, cyclic AMP receptor protein